MKTTDNFKKVIKEHLDSVAAKDPLFASIYKKEDKNIDSCITYILNTVQKSGSNGFSDDEIFGMAMHYYDEDKIEVGKPVNAKVIVNQTIELTPEEIEQAKEKARQEAIIKAVNEYAGAVELTPEDLELVKEEAKQKAFDDAVNQQKEKSIKKAAKVKVAVTETQSLFDE